jgi:thiamine transport system permease protein
VTVGFGFLITLDRPPLDLRTSPVLIPDRPSDRRPTLVVRTLRRCCGLSTTGNGKSPRRWVLALAVLATVDLPIIWRPLLAAVGLALAVSLGVRCDEFPWPDPTTRPSRGHLSPHRTPGVDNLGMALAASVILAVVTVTVMGVVERLRVSSWGLLMLSIQPVSVSFGATRAVDDVSLRSLGTVMAILGRQGAASPACCGPSPGSNRSRRAR